MKSRQQRSIARKRQGHEDDPSERTSDAARGKAASSVLSEAPRATSAASAPRAGHDEHAPGPEEHLKEELTAGGPMHASKDVIPPPHVVPGAGTAIKFAEPLNKAEERKKLQAIEQSPSYLRAYEDIDFLKTKELRPVRLQLELLKPEMILEEQGIESTIVVFGGTRLVSRAEAQARIDALEARLTTLPNDPELTRELTIARRILAKSRYYDEARAFGRLVSQSCQIDGRCDYVIMTGGGPGVMEAANRGAYDVGAKSIGMNITLPHEQSPNPYITPELCFQFHYFAIRKMHLLLRAKALVAFPGGYGTLDELFETLTLVQTLKVKPLPVLLLGREFWQTLINFQYLVDEGVIDAQDVGLFSIVDTANEAWQKICEFYTI